MLISVVFSITDSDKNNPLLQESLEHLCHHPHCEVIVVYKQSQKNDSSLQEHFQGLPLIWMNSEKSSRAERQNEGIEKSTAEVILLHHPRSLLQKDGLNTLIEKLKDPQTLWGGFTHRFDKKHFLLGFTSWYSNSIRCDFRGIVYLDHCIFFRRKLIEKNTHPVPEVDIFEDTDLSLKLRKYARPQRLCAISLTSAVRFEKNGFYKQALLNQFLKIGYFLKVPHKTMNRLYEKGLSLNSKYRN